MEVIAKTRNIRISPRKLRLVADAVRNLSPQSALVALEKMGKRAAAPLAKTINQALANATHNFNLKKEDLVIKKLEIEEGPTYKRWRAVSRGRAHEIKKRTSHIFLVLEGEEKTEKKKEK